MQIEVGPVDLNAGSPKVGLDVTQAVKSRGRGIARYINQIVPWLGEQSIDPILYIRGHRWLRRSLLSNMLPEAPRNRMPFSQKLRNSGLDLFHSFGNHLPSGSNVPLSFTVHDVRALDQPAGYEGKERLIQNIGRANGILCLTEYGKSRLLHHHDELDPDNLAVVPHGVDHALFYPHSELKKKSVATKFDLKRPYAVQVGSWFPHKNLEFSISGFARSDALSEGYQLVFVGGGAGTKYRAKLDTLADGLGISDSIVWLEHIGDQDLSALLSGAGCLLQPSRYEGFALPILEAMASGLPGVVSNSSCLPEVSAGIWPVVEQDDPVGFAVAMDHMLFNDTDRQLAIERGLAYARKFTWEKTAERTNSFFHRLLGL